MDSGMEGAPHHSLSLASQEEGPALGFVGTLVISSSSITLGSGDFYVLGHPDGPPSSRACIQGLY